MPKSMKFITNKHGFTLVEMLLALMIISFATLLIIPCLQIASRLQEDERRSDDRIVIHQLRSLMAMSNTYEVNGSILYLVQGEKNYQLQYDRHRLVKMPGYEIYLENIAEALFEKDGNCVYMIWRRNHEEKKALLACQ